MLAARLRTAPAPAPCRTPPARPRAAAAIRSSVVCWPSVSTLRRTVAQAAVDTDNTLVPYNDAEKKPAFVDGKINSFPVQSGVFAVYDSEDVLRFVGISRNISLSISEHAKALGDRVHAVKAAVIPSATKEGLTTAWKEWLQAAVRIISFFRVVSFVVLTNREPSVFRLPNFIASPVTLLVPSSCMQELLDAVQVNETGKIPPGNGDAEEKPLWQTRRKPVAKPEIKLTAGKGIEDVRVKMTELIGMVIKSEKVVAFIKGTRTEPQCGFSYQMLSTLNSMNVEYQVVNVLDEVYNPGLRETIKEFSQWPTIPQLYVNGEFVGGGDIVQQMAEDGELAKLLNE